MLTGIDSSHVTRQQTHGYIPNTERRNGQERTNKNNRRNCFLLGYHSRIDATHYTCSIVHLLPFLQHTAIDSRRRSANPRKRLAYLVLAGWANDLSHGISYSSGEVDHASLVLLGPSFFLSGRAGDAFSGLADKK